MTPSPASAPAAEPRWHGPALGIAAYGLWGLLPIYIKLLASVPPLQLLAHRVLWSLLLLVAIVTAFGRWGAILRAARGRTLLLLVGSAALIACNWLVYIWAVFGGHVLEASMGYFINPLVNVALGVALLGERLRRAQGVAVAVAALGVAVLAISGGGAIWVSLSLAFTFGIYGLLRKVAAIDALGGLFVETALLGPIALAYLAWTGMAGASAFLHQSAGIDLLLLLSGPVTAAPLLMFAAAARRMRYATLGLLQYIAPTLQFLQAVLLFGEEVRPVHMVAFGCIWAGLALYAADSLRGARAQPAPPPE